MPRLLLTKERIVPEMEAKEHWPAIVELVDHLININALDTLQRTTCLDALHKRETSVSTGIGSGVAVPHAFLSEIQTTQIVFGRSRSGIDFDALDCAPVRFVLLFLVPHNQHKEHLQTLANVAKTMSQCQIRRSLAESTSAQQLLSILQEGSLFR